MKREGSETAPNISKKRRRDVTGCLQHLCATRLLPDMFIKLLFLMMTKGFRRLNRCAVFNGHEFGALPDSKFGPADQLDFENNIFVIQAQLGSQIAKYSSTPVLLSRAGLRIRASPGPNQISLGTLQYMLPASNFRQLR
jgi:hypothetical protein